MKKIVIDARVWNSDVIVMIGGTAKEWGRLFDREHVATDAKAYWLERMAACTYGRGQFGAITMFSESTPWQVYVYLPTKPRKTVEGLCTVTHELLHVAIAILRRKNVPLTVETEEAYTYLTEHLTRSLWKALA